MGLFEQISMEREWYAGNSISGNKGQSKALE